MTKQFLQETNFQDDPDIPEQRAKDQLLHRRWAQEEEEIPEEE